MPSAWGRRNEVAVACVPKGATLTYLKGRAAPVVADRRRYAGGGVMYRVLTFDTDWIVSTRPLPGSGASLPRIAPRPCP
jgi:hypothetical protein